MLLAVICACEEPSVPEAPKAVIEGTFNSDGFPEVIFSSSIVPSISGDLAEVMINWGKVTISDGEREVILSGRIDNSCLPPFRYYSQEIQGVPGKRYTVIAKFKDLYAESTALMPVPTPIDSLTFSPTSVDTLKAVTLHFMSPDDTPAFYYLTLQHNERESRPGICMMSTLCADRPRTHYTIPVLRPKLKTNEFFANGNGGGERIHISQLISGEEWIVRLNRVDQAVYEFWKAYDNMIMFSTSPFISTNESLPSNVTGGLGVWSPQGSTHMIFKVP